MEHLAFIGETLIAILIVLLGLAAFIAAYHWLWPDGFIGGP